MADALAIIGLVSAIVQFVDFGSKIVIRLNEYREAGNNVPKTFQKISVDLPLVINNLQRTKNQADAGEINDETANVLKPVIETCLAQTKQLEELLEKALPAEGDSTWRRRKKALASLANGTAVQKIMSELEDHLRHLLYSQTLNGPALSGQTVVHRTSQLLRLDTYSGRQPRFMLKFDRERNFVGREDIIKEINRRFLDRQPCVAIAGGGGVG
jgi:ribosomal protein L17